MKKFGEDSSSESSDEEYTCALGRFFNVDVAVVVAVVAAAATAAAAAALLVFLLVFILNTKILTIDNKKVTVTFC
jgi:hypothetical protein